MAVIVHPDGTIEVGVLEDAEEETVVETESAEKPKRSRKAKD